MTRACYALSNRSSSALAGLADTHSPFPSHPMPSSVRELIIQSSAPPLPPSPQAQFNVRACLTLRPVLSISTALSPLSVTSTAMWGSDVYYRLSRSFAHMPLGATPNSRVVWTHDSICTELESFSWNVGLKWPMLALESPLSNRVVWSDHTVESTTGRRGAGYLFNSAFLDIFDRK
jgi:hypothetical protein